MMTFLSSSHLLMALHLQTAHPVHDGNSVYHRSVSEMSLLWLHPQQVHQGLYILLRDRFIRIVVLIEDVHPFVQQFLQACVTTLALQSVRL